MIYDMDYVIKCSKNKFTTVAKGTEGNVWNIVVFLIEVTIFLAERAT